MPPLPNQRAIAETLGTLDDKIDLNRRMNSTLERLAAALFRAWFVDFEPVRAKAEGREPVGIDAAAATLFPDGLVDSDVSPIPEGWIIVPLSEVATLTKGKSYKSSELAPSTTALVTLKSLRWGGGYRLGGLKPFTGPYKPEQRVFPGEVVVALTDVTQSADVVGKPAIVGPTSDFETLVASLDVGIVRRRRPPISEAFLYQTLASDRLQDHIRGFASRTTVLHLDLRGISDFPVPGAARRAR